MDPQRLSEYLGKRSPEALKKIRAIIPVHLFGQCADMNAINSVAAPFGIPVIEDAAQAIGAQHNGVMAGRMGWCATFSFFPSKNLGGLGDGGMMTTDDPELAAKLRLLRVHGSGATYYHKVVGVNSRLDTLQAAALLVKLPYLDGWTEGRRSNAETYRTCLSALPPGRIALPIEAEGMRHIYNQFTIRLPDRDRVRQRLTELGVGSAVYYPLPLHQQECFANLGYVPGDFPESERAAGEVLSLPIESGLGADDVRAVCSRLQLALGAN
jgi:dTDP-4-amino-4,6-dideoxygalactose transaminase